ncbi:MAG: response regulator [Elusimicrobiota bacterium]|jgi:CheY-like chemotaxis protein
MLFFGGKKKKTVLVVDDDAGARTLLHTFLEDSEYEVLEAGDAATGLAMAARHVPDLIIMDVMMPGTTGWDAVRALRGQSKTKAIPVLMCTCLSRMADVEKCLVSGANDYINKPYDLARLKSKIDKLLPPPTSAP